MKKYKAARPDEFVIEMLIVLDNFWINKVAKYVTTAEALPQ